MIYSPRLTAECVYVRFKLSTNQFRLLCFLCACGRSPIDNRQPETEMSPKKLKRKHKLSLTSKTGSKRRKDSGSQSSGSKTAKCDDDTDSSHSFEVSFTCDWRDKTCKCELIRFAPPSSKMLPRPHSTPCNPHPLPNNRRASTLATSLPALNCWKRPNAASNNQAQAAAACHRLQRRPDSLCSPSTSSRRPIDTSRHNCPCPLPNWIDCAQLPTPVLLSLKLDKTMFWRPFRQPCFHLQRIHWIDCAKQ